MEALRSKNNVEQSTGHDNPIAMVKNDDHCVEESKSPSFGKKAKRRNELMQESPKPPRSIAPRALFGSISQTWDDSRSSRFRHNL
jgi:hypothetical protein